MFLVPLFSKSGGFEGITVLFKKGEMKHGHRSIDEDFGIVSLVGELCDAYDIEIGADDIVPENFNSVEAICALITRLQED